MSARPLSIRTHTFLGAPSGRTGIQSDKNHSIYAIISANSGQKFSEWRRTMNARTIVIMDFAVLDLYPGSELLDLGPADIVRSCPCPSEEGEQQVVCELDQTFTFTLSGEAVRLDWVFEDEREETILPSDEAVRFHGMHIKICADLTAAQAWAEDVWRSWVLENEFWAMVEAPEPADIGSDDGDHDDRIWDALESLSYPDDDPFGDFEVPTGSALDGLDPEYEAWLWQKIVLDVLAWSLTPDEPSVGIDDGWMNRYEYIRDNN